MDDALCSKCRSVFSTPLWPLKGKLASEYDFPQPKALALHSDGIISLFASKNLPCHLCILIWEARREFFELLQQREGRDRRLSRKRTPKVEVRWRWEKTHDPRLVKSRYDEFIEYQEVRRLAFFIIENGHRNWIRYWSQDLGPSGDDLSNSTDRHVIVFWISPASVMLENKMSPIYNISNVSSSMNSDECVGLIKHWLRTCRGRGLTGHALCNTWNKSRGSWNPTRVLDVGASSTSRAKLFKPGAGSDPITYLTLSHRWGKKNLLTLKTTNILELSEELPVHSLSKTFQDAINITRKLGCQYLWIDSLCIIQDLAQDWRSESARMGDVYKFGYCNLAATGASDGTYDGLWVERDPLLVKPLLLNISTGLSGAMRNGSWTETSYIHRKFEEWAEVTAAALNKRGWVLQERIMSPRTLHFCRNQVIFECCEASCSERWPRLIQHNDNFRRHPCKTSWAEMEHYSSPADYSSSVDTQNIHFPAVDATQFWISVISYYTTMDLTMETDRLVALSGLARAVQHHLKDAQYVAGFWSTNLLPSLLWRAKKPTRGNWRKNVDYIAPSWSWMSADGQLSPYVGYHSNQTALVKLTDYDTTLVDDPLGQIKDGFLELRGKLAKGLVDASFYSRFDTFSHDHRYTKGLHEVSVVAYFDTEDTLPLDQIYCLPLFKLSNDNDPRMPKEWPLRVRAWILRQEYVKQEDVAGLLLLERKREPGVFRRCGIFEIDWKNVKILNEAIKSTSDNAASSGIPFEKTKDGNQFVITIV